MHLKQCVSWAEEVLLLMGQTHFHKLLYQASWIALHHFLQSAQLSENICCLSFRREWRLRTMSTSTWKWRGRMAQWCNSRSNGTLLSANWWKRIVNGRWDYCTMITNLLKDPSLSALHCRWSEWCCSDQRPGAPLRDDVLVKWEVPLSKQQF